ncbi:MAG: hypothetical protein ACRBBZ_05820 [Nitrosopumilus sp.]
MKLNRHDNLELRERILSMTHDERKQLGINKSTCGISRRICPKAKLLKFMKKFF